MRVAPVIALTAALTGPAEAAPAPRCDPGRLVFSAPYLPSGLALAPHGGDLVVVDRGALAVRDPATLRVKRTLLPQIDQWARAYFSTDGALLWAATVDGLRFTFDTAAWRPTRLTDDRAVSPKSALERDSELWYGMGFEGAAAPGRSENNFWRDFHVRLGLPALPAGSEVTAIAFGIARARAGRTVLDPLDPIAPGDDPTPMRLVVADSRGALHVYDDRRELATSQVLAGARVVDLDISGGRILAALVTGEVVLLTPALEVETRAMVRPQSPVAEGRGLVFEPQSATPRRHGITALAYDPASKRITWVSTDHATGVYDLAGRRTLIELSGTGAALVAARFLDERRVALLTTERLMLWDTVTGNATHELKGAFQAFAPAGGGLLAIRANGTAQLLDAGTLAPRREICFHAQGCAVPPLARPEGMAAKDWDRLPADTKRRIAEMDKLPDDRKFEETAREIHTALSPDGRSLAVLHPPFEVQARKSPGWLAVWDTRTLRRRRSVALDDCYDWTIGYASPKLLDVCGRQRRDAVTLAVVPGEPERPDPIRDGGKPKVTPVGRVEVQIWDDAGSDILSVVDTKRQKGLLDIALPESKGNDLDSQIVDHERYQLRRRTLVVAAPGGRRFLLAGRVPVKDGWLPGFAEPAGALQVWCAPDEPSTDPDPPPLPDDPPRAEFDGVTEIALDGFPEKIVAATEAAGRVFVLGSDAKGAKLMLVSVGADAAAPTLEGLPPGGPWDKILPSPDGTSFWLQAKGAVARRNADHGWVSFPLALGPDATTRFFAPLSATAALHVAGRSCRPDELAEAKGERNLREFYNGDRAALVIPRHVEGKKIELYVDRDGPDGGRAQESLRRRTEAVAALLHAPGADFAAVRARAIKDPQIGATSEPSFVLDEARPLERDPGLAPLFRARPGEVVGPISSRSADVYSVHERLVSQFMLVEKVIPERPRPFAELTGAAAQERWSWAGSETAAECIDATVVGVPGLARRTILPPHAARSFIAWRGGFAVLGNARLVYRDGAWVDPAALLAATLGALRSGDAIAAGDRIFIRHPHGVYDELDAATGQSLRRLTFAEHLQPQVVQVGPGNERVWAGLPGGGGTLVEIGARGTTTDLGAPPHPAWAGYGTPSLVPGQTARTFTTETAIIRRDGERWTAFFNPAARRRGLAIRRRDGGE